MGFHLHLLLALFTAASPPSSSRAKALATQHQWDTLLMEFSRVRAGEVPARDAASIAQTLLAGCRALSGHEWALANGLAEKSVAWRDTPEGLACLADSAVATQQSGAAEDALRRGVKRFPKSSALKVRLARLLLVENDAGGALPLLSSIRTGPERKEAQKLLLRARAMERTAATARRTAASEAAHASRTDSGGGATSGLTYASGEGTDGYRTRTNARFAIKYSANQRDFAQRANYEGQVVAALEEAHDFTERILGRARKSSVDVVLYTKDEFKLHFGAASAAAIAGLYNQSAIRINDAAQWTPSNRGTLVHEYVHAAVDEVAGFQMQRIPTWLNEGIAEYVQWRYEGLDTAPRGQLAALRAEVQSHRLVPLRSLAAQSLVGTANPALTYAESGVAAQLLYKRRGAEAFVAFLEHLGRMGQGDDFEKRLQADYDVSLDELQRDLESELGHR